MKKKALLALCTVAGVLGPMSASVALPAVAYASLPVLQLGAQGTAVTTLQNDLNAKGYPCGKADGSFGSATLLAVKSFQSKHGLTVDGVVGPSTWSALTGTSTGTSSGTTPSTTGRILSKKAIYFNGNLVTSPMAFNSQNTVYMPIWYVQNMLKSIGIQNQWDGVHWNLLVPSAINVDMSNLQVGLGAFQIQMNGVLVQRIDGIAYPDPNSHQMTTYMPVWYLMRVLDRIGIHSAWDGTNWKMTTLVTYTANQKDGTLLGQYQTQADAQNAVANTPGGIVKDSLGKVVFTEPDFGAYASPVNVPQEFTTQSAAATAINGNANGYVVDLVKNTVVQLPTNYYYVASDGTWRDTVTGPVSSTPPAFVHSGDKYVGISGINGSQFYLLSLSSGQYSGVLAGSDQNLFRSVDLRFPSPSYVTALSIDTWLQKNSSPLAGLGASFVRAQNTYGVNAAYLLSHSIEETGWGKSQIALDKNNLFGYHAFDSDPYTMAGYFPTDDYAIQFQAWFVRNDYLEQSAPYYWQAPTLNGMNHYYASDPSWSNNIATLMSEYVAASNGSASDFKQSTTGQAAPTQDVTQEPVFAMNGAFGAIQANPYGATLPVFSDISSGYNQMFPGTLQNGSTGQSVRNIQRVIGVTPDGQFGPMTQTALLSYQQSHGLPGTGVCDVNTWVSMFSVPSLAVPVGTQVAVDSMEQGFLGDNAVEWYHVTYGGVSGWVDPQYVAFKNMYRVNVSGSSVTNIYSSASRSSATAGTVHSGDYIVSNNPTASNGFIQVQFVNPTGTQVTGYLDSSVTQLSQVQPPAPYTGS